MFNKLPKEPVSLKIMRLTTPQIETRVSGMEPIWLAAIPEVTRFAAEWKWNASTTPAPVAKLKALATGTYQLPQTQGQIFAGEDFRAYLNVCNQQPAVRDALQMAFSFLFTLKVEIWREMKRTPTSKAVLLPVSVAYETPRPVLLKPAEFHDLIFTIPLPTAGTYSIMCHCECEPKLISLAGSEEPLSPEDRKPIKFRRIYKLSVEDPFMIDCHNYLLPSDNRVMCEVALTSNNEAGCLNLMHMEVSPTSPKQINIKPVAPIESAVFSIRHDQRIYVFEVQLLESNTLKLAEVLKAPLGTLRLEWRHGSNYQTGVSDDISLSWGSDIVDALCDQSNDATGDDLIDPPSLITTITRCPNEVKVGEPFSVIFTVKNNSILEEAKRVKVHFHEDSNIQPIGVFPVIVPLLPPAGSTEVTVKYVCLREGVSELANAKAECATWAGLFRSRGAVGIVVKS